MIRVRDISLPARHSGARELKKAVSNILGVRDSDISSLELRRRSVDARKKSDVRVIFTVDATLRDGENAVLSAARDSRVARVPEAAYEPPLPRALPEERPVVVGFGPAGMFTALILAMAGLRPIVLERGPDVERRAQAVERFWLTGELDPRANVQFGEGGAGAFSDGKLNTGVKNPRIDWILRRFVEFGAPESVAYDAKPHVGTDRLRTVVKNLRERVIALGGEVRFESALTGLELRDGRLAGAVVNGEYTIPCRHLVLAIGHSARDTLGWLSAMGVPMEPKPFAMGVRIEHPQWDIDAAQFGAFAGLPSLGPADYKLNCRTSSGGVYTFCMCPGGYVVAASSEEGGVVTNGMSYSGRAGENANSALLVGLSPEDFPYPGPLGGVRWQRDIEESAFAAGGWNYRAPAETVGSFLGRSASPAVTPTYRPGVSEVSLRALLPRKIAGALAEAIPELGRKLRGFDAPGALLTAPETRSSSPVRILRGEGRESVIAGLYPCGEGAGYAGGITSAAIDGMLTAEAIISSLF